MHGYNKNARKVNDAPTEYELRVRVHGKGIFMKIDKNLFEKLQGVVNRESFKDTNFALSCLWEYLDINGDNQIDLKNK